MKNLLTGIIMLGMLGILMASKLSNTKDYSTVPEAIAWQNGLRQFILTTLAARWQLINKGMAGVTPNGVLK